MQVQAVTEALEMHPFMLSRWRKEAREGALRGRGSAPKAPKPRCFVCQTRDDMDTHRVFKMSFASVYPHYVQKAEKKGRTRKEVDEVICWLTGYSPRALAAQIKQKKNFETFFREAPSLHPNAGKITGTICGVRIEAIENPLMRKIRYMDKLVDELAKGRPMDKILRT